MNAGIQIITAFLGALGFGVLYHIKGYKLVVVGAGGDAFMDGISGSSCHI